MGIGATTGGTPHSGKVRFYDEMASKWDLGSIHPLGYLYGVIRYTLLSKYLALSSNYVPNTYALFGIKAFF